MNLRRLVVYLTVWKLVATNALQTAFINRWTNVFFMVGKILRMGMSLLFLYLLKERDITIGEYTTDQVIVFFLTYQLIDTVSQMLYRGVYRFGHLMRSGEFDFLLIRPLNPLFRALTGTPDIDDALFLVPTLVVSGWILSTLELSITWGSAFLYAGLLLNSLLIVTGLHILVLSFGVLTTEVDNLIWTYRDLSRLGQFPIDMYYEPVRTALFFMLPIGLMITIPAQVLMNLPVSHSLGITTSVGLGFFGVSLLVWRRSIQEYSSASS